MISSSINKRTLIHRRVRDIADGGCLDDVADNKLLDGLVLGTATAAVGAADEGDVAAALLASSVIATLDSHVARGAT